MGKDCAKRANLSKQTRATWTDRDGTITTATPTGHTYPSSPPLPPASPPWPGRSFEERLAQGVLDVV